MSNTNNKIIKEVIEHLNSGHNLTKISKIVGYSRYFVRKIRNFKYKHGEKELLKKKDEDFIPHPKFDQDVIKLERRIRATSEQNKNLNKKYKKSLKRIDELSELLEINTSISKSIKKAPLKSPNPIIKSRAIPVLLCSDWHIEETVDPETVSGLNTYNIAIAKKRIQSLYDQLIYNIELFKKVYYIDTVVLALLGDLISGYIHEELIESNSLSPTEAIILLYELLSQIITDLSKDYKVIIPCAVGNHGRTTQKKKVGTSIKNSYEWLLYKNLADKFRNNNNIDFVISGGYHTYITIFDDYVMRFHHGDYMRYWGGVGGISIPVNKSIAQWDSIKRANLDCFGHFHQFKQDRKWICNGSLIGYNAFALSIKASYEPPSQAFFILDEKYGLKFSSGLYL